MEQKEKSPKELKALEGVKKAKAYLTKVRRDERKAERKAQNNKKYMMGGTVAKYFPENYDVYDFSEKEMNRIIACAFKNQGVLNMISVVVRERQSEYQSGQERSDVESGREG